MKVGVFSPTLNVYGGGEFVAVAMANTLAQNRHDVILFADDKVNPRTISAYFGETLHPKIQAITQPTHFTRRGLVDFYQTIVNSYVAKQKCDLFIDAFSNCVYPWTQISYIHFPYLNQHSFSKTFPYLGSPHITLVGTVPHVILEKKLINYDKRLVLANSHYTAEEIGKYSGKTVTVLYPPFPSTISTLGKEAIKNSRQDLVVTTSRLDPTKLLERIPLIAAKTNPSIHYAIVGRLCSKQTLTNLQSLIKQLGLTDRVKIYPDAPAEKKIELLKKAKVYLHTMVGEHFGISIVEAMALGCIPIVHDSGGMREFVPFQDRYESLQQAAAKIDYEIGHWSNREAERVKEISERFSLCNFSSRFMELFNKYYA
ncbi:MAG: glycosyltransferase [Candidatus Bathyarchaeota archaeon]|nr:glycosyltransferase [Candidatus Bathyarchaeota archaeon]